MYKRTLVLEYEYALPSLLSFASFLLSCAYEQDAACTNGATCTLTLRLF